MQTEPGVDEPFRVVGLFGDEGVDRFEDFTNRLLRNANTREVNSSPGRYGDNSPDENLLNIVRHVVETPWGPQSRNDARGLCVSHPVHIFVPHLRLRHLCY